MQGFRGVKKSNSSMRVLEASDSQALLNEIQVQENKMKGMADKLIVQDHELGKLRETKLNVEKLKSLEKQLDEKDKTIAELKKKVMMQEEGIVGWMDSIEKKKQLIKEKEKRCDDLESEIGSLSSKNVELNLLAREHE